MLSRLWVFSDLHIVNADSSLYSSLLKVLNEPSQPQDAVVFAGDIFDVLVGDSSYFYDKFEAFFERVRELAAQGVSVYFIEGNHDFHFQSFFEGTSVQFQEELSLLLQSSQGAQKIYIAHGDLVDQSDYSYRLLRGLIRSSWVKCIIHSAPGSWVHAVGQSWTRSPDDRTGHLPESWPTKKRDKLRSTFREFASEKKRQGFDFVILGHCHDFDQVEPFYFNMGYPPVHRQYLVYDSSQEQVQRRIFP